MKNLYCSFLNSSEASVSGDRLIYQDHPGEKPEIQAESPEGAKKEGSGLFDLVRRGQEKTQETLDFLKFIELKNKVDVLTVDKKITSGEGIKAIGKELNDTYKLGIDLNDPNLVIKTPDCDPFISISTSKETISIGGYYDIKISRRNKE